VVALDRRDRRFEIVALHPGRQPIEIFLTERLDVFAQLLEERQAHAAFIHGEDLRTVEVDDVEDRQHLLPVRHTHHRNPGEQLEYAVFVVRLLAVFNAHQDL
jgi:hypothetical protein